MLHLLGKIKRPALYQQCYDRLPALARSRDVTLREVDPPQRRPSWYDWEQETVVIVRGYGDDAELVTHEFGHHLHTRIFTIAQATAWQVFWAAHPLEMPTRYARKNAAEGWAETFMFRVLKRKLRAPVVAWLAGQGL
jgi:hypothetical protein